MNGTATRPPAATTVTPSPAPAAPAAAPKPAAAPVAAPAAAPKPAAAPAAAPKPNIGLPKSAVRPTVDPKQALGLPESPRSTIANLVKDSRVKLKLDQTFSAVPEPAVRPASAPAAAPAPTPVPVPAVPAAEPVVPAPEAVPVPAAVPAPAEPAAVEPPHPLDAKIQELQQQMEELKRQKTPAPAPVPATPAETPEQARARQDNWVSEYAGHIPVALDEAQMDTILAGGPQAVVELNKVRQSDMARAVLEARTSIYAELNPVMRELNQGVSVLLREHMDVQRFNIETQFFTKYPDLQPQRDYTNQVATYLLQTYPKECSQLQPDQFIDYLHGETTKLLDAQARRLGFSSWADSIARSAAAVPAAPVVAAPAPGAVPAAPVPAAVSGTPAAIPGASRHLSAPGPNLPISTLVPRASVAPNTPPSPHAPGAVPTNGTPQSWGSAVARDLRG